MEQIPSKMSPGGDWSLVAMLPLPGLKGETIGLLCGKADLDLLEAIVLERSGLGRTGETLLVGEGGILLSNSRFKGYSRGALLSPPYLDLGSSAPPLSWHGMYKGYRNLPVVASAKNLPGLEMTLVTEIEQREAFAPIILALLIKIAVALVTLVLAVVASTLFTRGLNSRLSGLAAAARQMSQGQLSRPAEVLNNDEISQVSAAFNAMTGRLEQRFEVERLMSRMARRLLKVTPEDMDTLVEEALSELGLFLNVDRILLLINSEDSYRLSCQNEWCDVGVPSIKGKLQNVESSHASWAWRMLKDDGVFACSSLDEIPRDGAWLRSMWAGFGIKSVIITPMLKTGMGTGLLSVETVWGERDWMEEEFDLLSTVVDILESAMERAKGQEALRRSEERYALAQRAANIGSWDWDISTGQYYWSEAIEPMLGLEPGCFKNTFESFLRYVHDEDKSSVLFAVDASLKDGRMFNVEYRIVRFDGSECWVSGVGAVFRDSQGEPLRMLGIMRNITERKMAEAKLESMNRSLEETVEERTRDLERKANELQRANLRLRELDRLKSSFLASVSHELRTPLTSILGFTKMIKRDFSRYYKSTGMRKTGKDREGRISENLNIIIHEGDRLTRLVNDVLDLTKIESGKAEWRNQAVDIEECVQKAVSAVQVQFDNRPDVRLEVEIPLDLPPLFVDPDRISQVLINLLNNAVKFTVTGFVRVSVTIREMDTVRICVQDTGQGVDPEELEEIFNKFHQATRYDALKNKPEGTGLGLSICKQIVEHYHGRIWAESVPDKGSEFYVELPLVPIPASALEKIVATTE